MNPHTLCVGPESDMKSKSELDAILKIIDKFDNLLSLIKDVTEISISPNANVILSGNLPSHAVFNYTGEICKNSP